MKVHVAVHGRYHAFELARGLYKHGILDLLQTTLPAWHARHAMGKPVPIKSEFGLEVLRRFSARAGWPRCPDALISREFGRRVARTLLGREADLLVGWSSATLEAIRPAHERGMKVIIERGSTHITHQTEILESAYRAFGLKWTGTPSEIISRELQEYAAADAICVPSDVARRTFMANGVPADKLIVNPLGVNSDEFRAPTHRREQKRQRILFVGTIGVRKGIARLLEAIPKLDMPAELILAGPVEGSFKDILTTLSTKNVTFTGPIPRSRIAALYQNADIFCLPSVEEGFGMVALEAMASGLPVVVSDQVGAADAIMNGDNGFVFPADDTDALVETLSRLMRDPTLRHSIGTKARDTVERHYGWDSYVTRAVTAYEAVRSHSSAG